MAVLKGHSALLTSEVWLGCPAPLALLLASLGSCCNPSLQRRWWPGCQFSAPSLQGEAGEPRTGWPWQWHMSLGGGNPTYAALAKQPFPLGTAALGSCPRLLPGLRPRVSLPALLRSTALSAFSLLWPCVSPELLANFHWSTVAKNTLSRGLLFGPSLPLTPSSNHLQTTGVRGVFSSLPLRPYGYLREAGGFLVSLPCHPNTFSWSGIWVSVFFSFQKEINFFLYFCIPFVIAFRTGSHVCIQVASWHRSSGLSTQIFSSVWLLVPGLHYLNYSGLMIDFHAW